MVTEKILKAVQESSGMSEKFQMHEDDMLLSVIIVHFKTCELTLQALSSVFSNTLHRKSFEVIVVDNHSCDGAESVIKTAFPEINWITSTANVGFGRANNLGISEAKGRFILLLNSDVLLPSGIFEKCLDFTKNLRNLGVLGCQWLNADGSHQKSVWNNAGNYDNLWLENLFLEKFFPRKSRVTESIGGAYMWIPRSVLEQVQGFDPDFFMYSEEIDLCNRIKKAGYELVFYSEATIIHLCGGSGQSNLWTNRHKQLSNALLYLKTQGFWGYWLFICFRVMNTFMNAVAMWFIDKDYRKNFLRSEYYFYSNFIHYMKIPFRYSSNRGKGKRQLRLQD